MPFRRRCPTCGSRQWHKEPASGLIACSEGHVLQNYRSEATDADELGPHALRKRTLKSGNKKAARESKANPQLYHGARGRYIYFTSLQFLLQKQIEVLTREWNLTPEFQVVCKDIWALHLTLLHDPPPEQILAEGETIDLKEDNEEDKKENPTPLPDEEESETEDEDLNDLLRINSESSEDESEGQEWVTERPRRARRGRRAVESPVSTIAVLTVACWTLRVPALCRDFIRLIERYELPYLDPVARGLLPEEITTHLSKHNIQALSPFRPPDTRSVFRHASRLAKRLHDSYGIFTPASNAAPILWRVVSQGICGTPMLYWMTKRMGRMLSLPLTLHYSLAPKMKKVKNYDPERHLYDNVAPEVALMGSAIIVLKMVYGLDGRSRVPHDRNDVACVLPEWEEYLARVRWRTEVEEKRDGQGLYECGQEVRLEALSEEEMDGYLGFGEHALVGCTKGDEILQRFFPLIVEDGPQQLSEHRRGSPRDGEKAVKAVKANGQADGGAALRPGESYWIGDTGSGEDWMSVVDRAARWLVVSREHLSLVLESFERRLLKITIRNRDT